MGVVMMVIVLDDGAGFVGEGATGVLKLNGRMVDRELLTHY